MLKFGGEDAQFFYLAENAGEGPARLESCASFHLGGALAVCRAVADSLRQVHQSIELHQAVCPANLRINRDGTAELRQDVNVPLAYISPEQTGRMNRGIDYRSDFYSMGVVFYEILTGQLPFPHCDALEMVHSHIARQACPPAEINHQIPPAVGSIIMKLLAKNAEDRYQSLEGVSADLAFCQIALRDTGTVPDFQLAEHDICDHLQIPQKLVGREAEVAQLLASFERVAAGGAELLLITGYSGIGKSSLVNEIHKPIVIGRGYFIAGKFDQFKRNIPYFAIAQAFRELIRQILTESETRIQEWKLRLLNALGPNGQLMIDAIPDLQYVIGAQPKVPHLQATESENRFHYVVRNFVSVFTQPQQPLVVFLDDLQWADEASLKLIQLFMTGMDRPSLLIIGSYRDNEVTAGAPLMQTVDAIRQQASVATIHLGPLSEQHVCALVADTVRADQDKVTDLAALVHRKTLGNPFFVGKFIKNLYNEKLLYFANGQWHWNLDQIEVLAITDNVVDLLAKEIDMLPPDTRHILTLAACIGSRFDFRTLASLAEKSVDEVKVLLQPGLQAGLIMTPDTTFSSVVSGSYSYRFLHDRVQQAAYAGIPEEERKASHLKIGRLLHAVIPEQERDEQLFAIVQQLNQGAELIDSHEERHAFGSLNLLAAKKAKATVAYEAALEYAAAGIALLEADDQNHAPLFRALQMEQLEASFLSHRFAEVTRLGDAMLGQAGDLANTGAVYEVLIHSALYQDRHVDGKVLAFEALRLFGVHIPERVNKVQLIFRLLKIKRLLGSRTQQQILGMAVETDADEILKQKILGRATSACYIANPALFPVLVAKQIGITLERNRFTSELPWALTGYAMVLILRMNELDAANKLGNLVLALSRKSDTLMQADSQGVRVAFGVYAGILHWKQHLATTVMPLYENYRAGLQIGEFEFAIYSLGTSLRTELLLGRHLPTLLDKSRLALSEAMRLRQKTAADGLRCNIHFIASMMDQDADGSTPWINDDSVTRLTLFFWHLFESCRLQLLDDADAALNSIRQSEAFLSSAACMAVVPVHHFYHAMCLCAAYAGMGRQQQRASLKKLHGLQKQFALWAHHAPMNLLHKWHLIEAERSRIAGNPEAAARHYDLAIDGAREHGYLNDEAMACERAARFYVEIGKAMHARMYMEQAYAKYSTWGATAKLARLEHAWPDLLKPLMARRLVDATLAASSTRRLIDIDTIIKASQTLSGEIQLDNLLEKLMRLLIENAGAQRGVLLLQKEGSLTVQAKIDADGIEVRQDTPASQSADLSLAVMNYVRHTREKVVLSDAGKDVRFNADSYIASVRPKSVLCIPLQKQTALVGILYLENNLALDAFTPERCELLEILSTQIAMSLENAGLYTQLEQKVEARTQALSQKNQELSKTLLHLEQTQQQLVESAKLASLGQLVAGVAHEINTPVGVGVTAASTLAEETERIGVLYQDGTMKRSDLETYVSTATTISKLLLSNMDRAATLIQSFKDVAIDQTSEVRRKFRLRKYIDEVLLNLSPMLRKQGHSIEVDCEESIEVDTYPGALSQVLTNFVMNALLHAFYDDRPGSMAVKVSLLSNSMVELYFSDNGKGIPAENLTKIFDPFFTTMRGQGGSGLGLSIIHNLITGSLNGSISVQSAVNAGTTFTVCFPSNLEQALPSSSPEIKRRNLEPY